MGDDCFLNRLKRNCPYLIELDLSYNNLKTQDIKILMTLLKNNTQLTSLNLEGNNLIDKDALLISDMLNTNTTLEVLNITNNSNISDLGTRALGKSIMNREIPVEVSLVRQFIISGCVNNTVYQIIKKE